MSGLYARAGMREQSAASPFPTHEPELPLIAGVELGGTKAVALIARGREIIAMKKIPTAMPEPTLGALADQIEDWASSYGAPAAIGIASFGPVGLDPVRRDYGTIIRTPKPGWSNTDVAGFFAARFALPIHFDTDVAGAALAEYHWGAGRGCDTLVYLTVGTGIGAGILVGGRPVHGLMHPEFGHIYVRRAPSDDFAGTCPFHGDCLEGLASGPAIAARAGCSGDAVADDHPVMIRVVDEMAEAMAQLLLTLSPKRILIGGGVFEQRPGLFPPLCERTSRLIGGYISGIDAVTLGSIIVPPGLAGLAGPLGAVALAGCASL